jgi:O-acetyl-ADP-ribose deacetylase (regulator of RNase III)
MVTGDVLDQLSPTSGLIHCVGADLRMAAGLARQVAGRSGRPVIGPATPIVGSAVMQLSAEGVWLCHMVTKPLSSGEPTYSDLRLALVTAVQVFVGKGIRRICMPRIGCGLDGLLWSRVRAIISEVCGRYGVEPVVCTLLTP